MTQNTQPTPKQLAYDVAITKETEWFNPIFGFYRNERLQILIIEAITQATEPLRREIAQLESEKAALVEALHKKCNIDYYASDAIAASGSWDQLKEYCNAHNEALEALGNTTQQAQARDAMLIEKGRQKGIDEAIPGPENPTSLKPTQPSI